MKDAEPFDEIPHAGPDAKTVELDAQDLLNALGHYIGVQRGESFLASATIQWRMVGGELHCRYTYWKQRPIQ